MKFEALVELSQERSDVGFETRFNMSFRSEAYSPATLGRYLNDR